MNWYKLSQSTTIGFHATNAEIKSFDNSFMQDGNRGYGFYFGDSLESVLPYQKKNIYQVSLPPISSFLNWNQEFGMQSSEVINSIRSVSPDIDQEYESRFQHFPGQSIYYMMVEKFNGLQSATANLNRIGVKGLVYGEWRSGHGKNAYVIFDASSISNVIKVQ